MEAIKKMFGKIRGARGIEWLIPIVLIAMFMLVLINNEMSGGVQMGTDLEQRLEKVLSAIDGAGQVRVMVSEKAEIVSAFSSTDTTSAEVLGVLIVAEGAGDIRVRLALTNAVRALLDVELSSIEIVEMRRD